MSVINKMLRDLDQRQAKDRTDATRITPPADVHVSPAKGAVRGAVNPPVENTARRMALWLGASALLAGACAVWWWQARDTPPLPTPVASPAAPTVLAVAPVATPASAAQPASAAVTTAAPGATTTVPTTAPAQAVLTPAPSLSAPSLSVPSLKPAAMAESPISLGLRMDPNLLLRKAPDKKTERVSERAAEKSAQSEGTGANPNDALERSQTLWNAGSRDAAIDLLQDAVALAERQGAGVSPAQGNPVLLPLVRELTRLQLSESRHSAVWELLARLEPQLGNAPDLWAIRASAAQRLGRHQDSVRAYLMALQSRPAEQRWLLGAAVSLAALGQANSSAEMADKARAVGTVSPDVLTYLRQQGVPLRDK